MVVVVLTIFAWLLQTMACTTVPRVPSNLEFWADFTNMLKCYSTDICFAPLEIFFEQNSNCLDFHLTVCGPSSVSALSVLSYQFCVWYQGFEGQIPLFNASRASPKCEDLRFYDVEVLAGNVIIPYEATTAYKTYYTSCDRLNSTPSGNTSTAKTLLSTWSLQEANATIATSRIVFYGINFAVAAIFGLQVGCKLDCKCLFLHHV